MDIQARSQPRRYADAHRKRQAGSEKSYSVLQDDSFNAMRAAGYTDVERDERGSTEEHLTVTQFKVA